jgi:teichuronic acid exporter
MSDAGKVSRATLWSALDVLLGQLLSFTVIVFLARLLTPEEFGTVALMGLFTGVAKVLVESGFGSALIQRQNVSDDDKSTVFWFSTAISLVVATALVAAAPLIASFFERPVLREVTFVLAASIAVGALGIVHRSLLAKTLNFQALAVVNLVSASLAGIVAIILALAGYGVFALAWQMLIAASIGVVSLWIIYPWRPNLIFSRASLRRLFGFGGYMLAVSMLDTAYTKGYSVLLGKLHGAGALGLFARAEAAAAMPSAFLTGTLARVAFPAFSGLGEDKSRLRDGMRSSVQTSMLVNAPAALGLAAIADPFVHVFYGQQWGSAVPLLQILCLSGIFMPLHILNLHALMATGRSDLFFRLELAKKILGVTILLGASTKGPIGLAWGMVGASVIAFLINTSQSRRQFGYGSWQQVRDAFPAVCVAAVMALTTLLVVEVMEERYSDVVRLGAGMTTGIAMYSAIALTLRLKGVEIVQGIIRNALTDRE